MIDITGYQQIEAKPSSFLSWIRPRSYWDVVGQHLPLSLVTGIALLLSNRVSCELLPLKHCTFLGLTGYPCPFCGFTRSFWAMAGGDWSFVVQNCPLVWLVYFAVVIVFAWNTTGLLLGVKIIRGRYLRLRSGQGRWAIGLVSALFILNWVFRLSLGLK